jgi:hypothetical protein
VAGGGGHPPLSEGGWRGDRTDPMNNPSHVAVLEMLTPLPKNLKIFNLKYKISVPTHISRGKNSSNKQLKKCLLSRRTLPRR